MSDPIGTIRREEHDGGYSIWVRVDFDRRRDERPWLCVHSTAWGNVGERLAHAEGFEVVGAIPHTPAARRSALLDAIRREKCGGCRSILERDLAALERGHRLHEMSYEAACNGFDDATNFMPGDGD